MRAFERYGVELIVNLQVSPNIWGAGGEKHIQFCQHVCIEVPKKKVGTQTVLLHDAAAARLRSQLHHVGVRDEKPCKPRVKVEVCSYSLQTKRFVVFIF